jgi:hypothetical protein
VPDKVGTIVVKCAGHTRDVYGSVPDTARTFIVKRVGYSRDIYGKVCRTQQGRLL